MDEKVTARDWLLAITIICLFFTGLSILINLGRLGLF